MALKTSTETAYSFQSCSFSGSTPQRRKSRRSTGPSRRGRGRARLSNTR